MRKDSILHLLIFAYIGIIGIQFFKNYLGFGQPIATQVLFSSKKSLGSVAVGTAEGNLTSTGEKTGNYFRHIDPGNQVQNRGFCSWNKAASLSVAEADRRCLAALQRQAASTERKMKALGVTPHPKPLINGADIWNQSNTAGPQFANAYKRARERGMFGDDAVLWARVEAFRDKSGVLNASGLFRICRTQPYYIDRLVQYSIGSEQWRWQCIALDQQRRVKAINGVIN